MIRVFRCASTGTLALVIALIAGCGESSKDEVTATATSVAASPTVTVLPGEDPIPVHVTFPAGETISADGKTGIFFLDPRTGDAEAWVVAAGHAPDGSNQLPFSFWLGGVSTDGSNVVYTCLESSPSGVNPCGTQAHHNWYLLDTATARRARLDAFTGDFVSISPDGKTLLGRVAQGIAVADSARPTETRPVDLPRSASDDLASARAYWSPDSTQVVLAAGERVRSRILIDVGSGGVVTLDASTDSIKWASDGSSFAVGRHIDKSQSELAVLDRNGQEIWAKRIAGGGVSGTWSVDGAYLYAQEEELPATGEFGPLHRVVVIDADTGATAYRIRGALCPSGWAGGSHTFLTSVYGFASQAVVDLDARSLTLIDAYVAPTPFDENLAIAFDGSDFYSYDLPTGRKELIARTTVFPAWDFAHDPLFVGDRLIFTSLHGGHGGCGEGNSPKDPPPPPELLDGPFADDAPVRRGGPQ